MNLERHIGVVGSRDFRNYRQMCDTLNKELYRGDIIVSGGAAGADSLAQRYAKEYGFAILIFYPDYQHYGRGATFARNKLIAEASDKVFAFYVKDRFQQGGTRNTIEWAEKLGVPYKEYSEDGD